MKTIFKKIPEYYLIVLILLAGYTPPITVNTLSLVLVGVLILQIIYKNRLSGLLLTGLAGILNIVMLFALLSEVNEFVTFTTEARNLLVVGIPLFILNTLAIFFMFQKYFYTEQSVEASL